jgi:hypothetical protein
MKRVFFLLGLFAAAAPASADERRYPLTDFDRVIVEGPYVVHIVTGRPTAARAIGSRQALDLLTLDQQGQMLRIRRNRTASAGNTAPVAGVVHIELAARNLRSARIIGPTQLSLENARGLNLELSVEGSGALRATGIDAENLSLALIGSGGLEIAGSTRALTGNFQGTGEIRAAELRASRATIVSTNSGAVAVQVNGPVTVTSNGLGQIRIFGRPDCTVRGLTPDVVACDGSDQRQSR